MDLLWGKTMKALKWTVVAVCFLVFIIALSHGLGTLTGSLVARAGLPFWMVFPILGVGIGGGVWLFARIFFAKANAPVRPSGDSLPPACHVR